MSQTLPERLQAADVPASVVEVLEGLGKGGFEAFLVGGCVRDLLLGKAPKDWDIASQATPADVQKLFRKVIPTGIQHGTVTVLSRGAQVEVTTYRFEGEYVDGRRPSKVEFRRELKEDLARRDFTINAMAFNPVRKDFRDPFQGQQDLQAGVIRCVGRALDRFGEDGLRALRAVRFSAVLELTLDPETEAAISPTRPIFRKVANERVREEMMKLLLARAAESGLQLLERTGLLEDILPEVVGQSETFAAVGRSKREEETRLATLLRASTQPRERMLDLKFPNRTADQVALLVQNPVRPELISAPDGAIRRWVAKLGEPLVPLAMNVARAVQMDRVESFAARVESLLGSGPPLNAKALALDGRKLMELLGVGPSPLVGEATRFLLEQVLDDPSLNTEPLLRERLTQWKATRGSLG